MKRILYYFITISFLLQSCTNDISDSYSVGLLEINPIAVESNVEVSPLSRTVDDRLQIDIYNASTVVKTFQPGEAALDALIELPVGDNYRLIAHTPDMEEAGNQEAGVPLYSVSHDFIIQKDMVTKVEHLTAKQVNVGIGVNCDDEVFMTAFKSIECIISSSSGRIVTIDVKQPQEKVYFNVGEGVVITYQIKSVNGDGEQFETEVKTLDLEKDTMDYVIDINI